LSAFEIEIVPVLSDNYVYLVRDPETGYVAVVDPSVADPVIAALEARGWTPDVILNTHHHPDHVGGNAGLKARYGCDIVAPAADSHRIRPADRWVKDGDRVAIGAAEGHVMAVPGHTTGHIAYYFPEQQALFCGDTLFSLGCGRLFEGTPQQMWQSLSRLRTLPDETLVCCAHEYTAANGRYALTVEPENESLQARLREVDALRAEGSPSVPSSLGLEKAANPFLRPESPEIRRNLDLESADDVTVFAALRAGKDRF